MFSGTSSTVVLPAFLCAARSGFVSGGFAGWCTRVRTEGVVLPPSLPSEPPSAWPLLDAELLPWVLSDI